VEGGSGVWRRSAAIAFAIAAERPSSFIRPFKHAGERQERLLLGVDPKAAAVGQSDAISP
jgi:hypothetical protein